MLIHLDLDNKLYNIALDELIERINTSEVLSTFEFLILPDKWKESYIDTGCSIEPAILSLIDEELTKKYLESAIRDSNYLDEDDFEKLDKSVRKLYVEMLVEINEDVELEFYEFQYLEDDTKLDYVTNTGLNNLSEDFKIWFSGYKRQLKMDSVLK